jgi:hypothetical protein
MMPVTLSVLSAALIAIFLWRVWKTTSRSEFEYIADTQMDGDELQLCPGEFVAALFRHEDWEFVSQFDSEPLKALFLAERKSLAIAWVRATAVFTRRIMREHVLTSRRSSDLEIGTEVRIYSQYVALQAACVILHLSIELMGPVRWGSLSQRVYRLSERISEAHSALQAANLVRELQGI